ncbi:MAG TPA: polyhydroxyalkanoic acid system family protein [Novosphingobium sp.]|nr:polyhydroxyalkanoic acid system family protein [Novosphingobium sp.]
MRVALPHHLGKDEVRRRLKARTGDVASYIPGGMAQVDASWPDEDTLALGITAMGQFVGAKVAVEETQMVVEIDLPPQLGFVRGVIEQGVRQSGMKLLK